MLLICVKTPKKLNKVMRIEFALSKIKEKASAIILDLTLSSIKYAESRLASRLVLHPTLKLKEEPLKVRPIRHVRLSKSA